MEVRYVQNEKLNKKVTEIINSLKEEIFTRFHPKSIILSGSFGRGEGTVIEEDGGLKFLSDCEIIIIPYTYIFSRKRLNEFESGFYNRTGLKVGIWGATLSFYSLFPFLNKNLKPTMINYDLKYGSKVIYGKNYLERIPNFKPEDIPLWEGIKLMFNRMAEALQYFSINYLDKYPSEEEERKLFFWINKIILACQDALLISAKKYHSSYKVRNDTFQEIFPKYFEALDKQIPNLLLLTVKATEYKLTLIKPYSKNVVNFWFEVAEIADKVFRYIMEKEKRITFDSYAEFQEKYLKHPHIREKYYRGLTPNPIYQNLRSAVKMWIFDHKIPTIKLMRKSMVPWTHVVYSIIPVVYFGVSKDGKVDEPSLTKARESLSLLRKLSHLNSNLSQVWESTKGQALDLWWTVCY